MELYLKIFLYKSLIFCMNIFFTCGFFYCASQNISKARKIKVTCKLGQKVKNHIAGVDFFPPKKKLTQLVSDHLNIHLFKFPYETRCLVFPSNPRSLYLLYVSFKCRIHGKFENSFHIR